MAVRVGQVKIALAPFRVSRRRLRRETAGQHTRVHGVNIVDVENHAHHSRERRLIVRPREIQGSRADPERREVEVRLLREGKEGKSVKTESQIRPGDTIVVKASAF